MTLCSKLSSAYFAIRTTSIELDPSVARPVYFALFEYHLRYWGITCQNVLNVIFIVQKKVVRAIANVGHRDSCIPILFFRESLRFPFSSS